ncbi:MAG: hypothetical protein PF961_11085 [Planctomycetota bacterium]|jgi:hypothetical protein|nr:hypothetical protein [Planctomycetota bacterium]
MKTALLLMLAFGLSAVEMRGVSFDVPADFAAASETPAGTLGAWRAGRAGLALAVDTDRVPSATEREAWLAAQRESVLRLGTEAQALSVATLVINDRAWQAFDYQLRIGTVRYTQASRSTITVLRGVPSIVTLSASWPSDDDAAYRGVLEASLNSLRLE